VNSMSRPRYTNTDDDQVSGAAGEPTAGLLAESILYVCALIADRPRAIDRCIDYFGERRPVTRVVACSQRSSPAAASGCAAGNHSAEIYVETAWAP